MKSQQNVLEALERDRRRSTVSSDKTIDLTSDRAAAGATAADPEAIAANAPTTASSSSSKRTARLLPGVQGDSDEDDEETFGGLGAMSGATGGGDEFGSRSLNMLRASTRKLMNSRRLAARSYKPSLNRIRRFDLKMTEEEKKLVGSMLGSMPLMRKCCELLETFQQHVLSAKEGDSKLTPPTAAVAPAKVGDLMNIVASVIHQVKFCTARDCWRNFVKPLQDHSESLARKHEVLQSQLTQSRAEWLKEITSLRDSMRKTGGFEGDIQAELDIKSFMDPALLLSEEETEFALKVAVEKLKMIFEHNPKYQSQGQTVDLRQMDAWAKYAENSEVDRLRKQLASQEEKMEELVGLVNVLQAKHGDVTNGEKIIPDAARRLETLQAMNMASNLKMAEMQDRVNEVEILYERSQQEFTTQTMELEESVREVERLSVEIRKLEEALRCEQFANETNTREIERLKNQLEIARETLDSQRFRIEDLRSANEDLQVAVYSLESQAQANTEKLRLKDAKMAALKSAEARDNEAVSSASSEATLSVSHLRMDFSARDKLHQRVADLEEERRALKAQLQAQARQLAVLGSKATLEQVEELSGAVNELVSNFEADGEAPMDAKKSRKTLRIAEETWVEAEPHPDEDIEEPEETVQDLEKQLNQVSDNLSKNAAQLRELVKKGNRQAGAETDAEQSEEVCTEEFVKQEEMVSKLRSQNVKAEVGVLSAKVRDLRFMIEQEFAPGQRTSSPKGKSKPPNSSNNNEIDDSLGFDDDEEEGGGGPAVGSIQSDGLRRFSVLKRDSLWMDAAGFTGRPGGQDEEDDDDDEEESVAHMITWAPGVKRRRMQRKATQKAQIAYSTVQDAMGLLTTITEKLRDVASENVWLRQRATEATTEMQRAAIRLHTNLDQASPELQATVQELGAMKVPLVFQRLYNDAHRRNGTLADAAGAEETVDLLRANLNDSSGKAAMETEALPLTLPPSPVPASSPSTQPNAPVSQLVGSRTHCRYPAPPTASPAQTTGVSADNAPLLHVSKLTLGGGPAATPTMHITGSAAGGHSNASAENGPASYSARLPIKRAANNGTAPINSPLSNSATINLGQQLHHRPDLGLSSSQPTPRRPQHTPSSSASGSPKSSSFPIPTSSPFAQAMEKSPNGVLNGNSNGSPASGSGSNGISNAGQHGGATMLSALGLGIGGGAGASGDLGPRPHSSGAPSTSQLARTAPTGGLVVHGLTGQASPSSRSATPQATGFGIRGGRPPIGALAAQAHAGEKKNRLPAI